MSKQSHDPAVLAGLDSLRQQARRLGDILDQMRRMVHLQTGTPPRSV